ncbi:MAG: hypothetical protein LLG42_04785 [Chloroflexi bacterium]|nr:hypothetical protein [Chloroflexota bacterium]
MVSMTMNDVMLTMTICIFFVGIVSLGAGVFILVSRVLNDDFRVLAEETSKLARKGISDDISGLVGNASLLLNSLNELIKTTRGIGLTLMLLGMGLVVVAYFLLQKIY